MDHNRRRSRHNRLCRRYGNFEKNAKSAAGIIIEDARREADIIKEKNTLKAKEEEMKILADAERTAARKCRKPRPPKLAPAEKEQQLSQQQNDPARRKKDLDSLKTNLDAKEQNVNNRAEQVEQLRRQAQEELERVSGLSVDEAREKLVESLKDEAKTAAALAISTT